MQPLVHPKLHSKLLSKLCIFAISQKLEYKFGEKTGDHVCFDGIDQFYKYLFIYLFMYFLHLHLLLIGKNVLYL